MIANNLAQTSTTTGTGNIALSSTGWNGCNTLWSFFNNPNHRFEYSIINDNGEKEKGLGRLLDATTLVRETVIDNHLGTTGFIDFSSGTKIVMCSSDAGNGIVPLVRPDGELCSLHAVSGGAVNVSLVANIGRLTPHWNHRPVAVSAVGINVATVVASSTIRLAIYQLTAANTVTGYTFSLLRDFGQALSSGSAGNREFVVSDLRLGVGTYFMYVVSNSNPAVRALGGTSGSIGLNDSGSATAITFTAASNASAVTAAPATITVANPASNTNSPRIYLKGRYL